MVVEAHHELLDRPVAIEIPASPRPARTGSHRALVPGSAGHGAHPERSRRPGARRRRPPVGRPVHRHGAPRGLRPVQVARDPGPPRRGASDRLHPAGVRRGPGGPRARHHSSRHQAAEPLRGSAGRRRHDAQGPRFRHLEGHRRGAVHHPADGVARPASRHRRPHGHGLARAHVARADGVGARRGRPHGRLVARRHALRARRRQGALRGRLRRAGLLGHPGRSAGPPPRLARARAGRAGRRDPQVPPARSQGAVRDRQRFGDGAPELRLEPRERLPAPHHAGSAAAGAPGADGPRAAVDAARPAGVRASPRPDAGLGTRRGPGARLEASAVVDPLRDVRRDRRWDRIRGVEARSVSVA